MHRLFPEKMVTIITSSVLEDMLVKMIKKCGASGYTISNARGGGGSGENSGDLDGETNIKMNVVLPEAKLECMIDSIDRLFAKGHHLTLFVSDVSVLQPDKYNKPMD